MGVSGVGIGEAQCAAVGQVRSGRVFGDTAGGVNGQRRRIVTAGNVDGDILGIGAAVAVINRDGEDRSDGLASSEEIKFRSVMV